MTESKFEAVSSFVDNHQSDAKTCDELLNNPQLADTWNRYHLIGDVVRGETAKNVDIDLSARIAAAIADEPAILAPKVSKVASEKTFKAKVIQLFKPVGQMAIAASAAGLVILGVQQNVAEQQVLTPDQQVVQTIPLGGIADPVSYNFQQPSAAAQKQAYIEQQRRFQALLDDHQQQIKLSQIQSEEVSQNPEAEAKDTLK